MDAIAKEVLSHSFRVGEKTIKRRLIRFMDTSVPGTAPPAPPTNKTAYFLIEEAESDALGGESWREVAKIEPKDIACGEKQISIFTVLNKALGFHVEV